MAEKKRSVLDRPCRVKGYGTQRVGLVDKKPWGWTKGSPGPKHARLRRRVNELLDGPYALTKLDREELDGMMERLAARMGLTEDMEFLLSAIERRVF